MALITKTDLFVLGAGITGNQIGTLEVNGLVVIKHSPDALAFQNLIAFIGCFVYLLY
jgi:hypothetical protein